jgi:hypothetical protein
LDAKAFRLMELSADRLAFLLGTQYSVQQVSWRGRRFLCGLRMGLLQERGLGQNFFHWSGRSSRQLS